MAAEREGAKRESADRATPEPPSRVHPGAGPAALSNSAVLGLLAARREQSLGSGRPLEAALRARMEERFAASFDDVRIHTDSGAGDQARRYGARAYTRGSDIVFGAGQYSPGTAHGRRLLAHELAHVLQQQRGAGLSGVPDHDTTEGEAHRAADSADHDGPIRIAAAAAPGIQRERLNYTPPRPIVSRVPAGHQGYVKVNGEDIAAGTVGDPDKFLVDWVYDDSSGHLSIGIKVWPGSDMAFTADATSVLDSACLSYVATIFEHTQIPVYPESWKEGWTAKQTISKAPPKVEPPKTQPKKPKINPPKKQPPKKKEEDPTIPANYDPTKDKEPPKPTVYDPLHDDPSAYQFADHPTVQDPAIERAKKLLDAGDLKAAAEMSGDLSDEDLQSLSPLQRSQLLWGLGLYPENDALDMDEVDRVFNNTPDSQLMELQRALSAGNGQLLNALKSHAQGDDDLQRLGQAVTNVIGRSIMSGASDLDWSLTDVLSQQPDFEVPKGDPLQWLGDKPYWAKDLQVWKDDRGNWNFFDEEHGFTKIDPFGKTVSRGSPFGSELLDRMKKGEANSEELYWAGGKRYVEGLGLLDEQQFSSFVEKMRKEKGGDANRELENLGSGVMYWDEQQKGWKAVPSFFSHAFGGVGMNDPQRIYDRTKGDVSFQMGQFDKVQTSTDLKEVLKHLKFATDFGNSEFYNHKEKVYGGGKDLIFTIKVGAVATTVIVTGGYALTAAPTVLSLEGAGLAFGGGAMFSAGRQGVQLAEGSRKDFSGWEMLGGGAAGVGLYVAPWALPAATGLGMANSLNEAEKGNYATFGFDMLAPIGAAKVTSPEFLTWARPRVAGALMYSMLGTQRSGISHFGFGGGGGPRANIVMVEGVPGAQGGAPYEVGIPSFDVAPNPAAFVGPQTGSPSNASPYNFPIIINLAPQAPQRSPAESGPQSIADAYKNNAPTIKNAPMIQFPIQQNQGIAPMGVSQPYWRFGKRDGVGGADYIDPADMPFANLSKRVIVSEDEHIRPTKGVQSFMTWSKGGSQAFRWPAPAADIKTPVDQKLIAAVKAGRITPEYFLKEARRNLVRAWFAARAQGIPVPPADQLVNAILLQEAQLKAEMSNQGLSTNW